jgi:hypothetical protein
MAIGLSVWFLLEIAALVAVIVWIVRQNRKRRP